MVCSAAPGGGTIFSLSLPVPVSPPQLTIIRSGPNARHTATLIAAQTLNQAVNGFQVSANKEVRHRPQTPCKANRIGMLPPQTPMRKTLRKTLHSGTKRNRREGNLERPAASTCILMGNQSFFLCSPRCPGFSQKAAHSYHKPFSNRACASERSAGASSINGQTRNHTREK